MLHKHVQIKRDAAEIEPILNQLTELMKRRRINSKTITTKQLELEEILAEVIRIAETDGIGVTLRQLGDDISVKIAYKGSEFKMPDPPGLDKLLQDSAEAEDSCSKEEILRNLLLRHYKKDISASSRNGINVVVLTVQESAQKSLRNVAIALGSGILFGLLVRLIDPEFGTWLSDHILDMLYNMFLNGIKIVGGPLVFLSIVLGISDSGSMTEMGKTVRRIFLLTGVFALVGVLVGWGAFLIFPVGDPILQHAVQTGSGESGTAITLLGLIEGIVPSSFLGPLVSNDMLQILFLSVLCGVAITKLGEARSKVNEVFNITNRFITTVAEMILKFMPVSVFCAMANMAIDLDLTSAGTVLGWLLLNVFAFAASIFVMLLVLFLLTRESPIRFLKKYGTVLLNALATSSSSAVMPLNMKICKEKLGIRPAAYSLAIPLGTTINKVGGVVDFVITGFFMAKVYEVTLTPSCLITVFVMAVVLAVAAPSVPGATIICFSVLLPAIGVPAEAISLIIGLLAVLDPAETLTNVAGNGISAFIAAKRGGMVDETIWKS